MIRARIRYTNGVTVVRQGTALIDACLAAGLKIVPSDDNRGLEQAGYTEKDFETADDVPDTVKKKRPRITKEKA